MLDFSFLASCLVVAALSYFLGGSFGSLGFEGVIGGILYELWGGCLSGLKSQLLYFTIIVHIILKIFPGGKEEGGGGQKFFNFIGIF